MGIVDHQLDGATALLGIGAYLHRLWPVRRVGPDDDDDRAFWSFGGVPKTLVIDNLKPAVTRPDRYTPTLDRVFLEYANSLGFSLCFQSFDEELAGLPGNYAPPRGRLLLAHNEGQLAGCAALHPIDHEICEMKRLYVRPQFRGLGFGKLLLNHLADHARAHGVGLLRLETGIHQTAAIRLYEGWGFQGIPPFGDYVEDPLSLFYEKRVT